ncbi:hypothetical protein ACSBR2_029544 [Camellia fascicularis]
MTKKLKNQKASPLSKRRLKCSSHGHCLCLEQKEQNMSPSFYTLLQCLHCSSSHWQRDYDLDDGEIASFVDSETHHHFDLESKPTEDEVQERSRPKICITMASGSRLKMGYKEDLQQHKLRNDTWMEQTKLVFFYQGKLLAKSATKIKHRYPKVPLVSWSNICKYDMFPSIALAAVAECGKQQVGSNMQQGNINN